jgi:hypothetical protein
LALVLVVASDAARRVRATDKIWWGEVIPIDEK